MYNIGSSMGPRLLELSKANFVNECKYEYTSFQNRFER